MPQHLTGGHQKKGEVVMASPFSFHLNHPTISSSDGRASRLVGRVLGLPIHREVTKKFSLQIEKFAGIFLFLTSSSLQCVHQEHRGGFVYLDSARPRRGNMFIENVPITSFYPGRVKMFTIKFFSIS